MNNLSFMPEERQPRDSYVHVFSEKNHPENIRIALAFKKAGGNYSQIGRYFKVDHGSIRDLCLKFKGRLRRTKSWDRWTSHEKKEALKKQFIPLIYQTMYDYRTKAGMNISKPKAIHPWTPRTKFKHVDVDGSRINEGKSYKEYLKEYDAKAKPLRQERMKYFRSQKRDILKTIKAENKVKGRMGPCGRRMRDPRDIAIRSAIKQGKDFVEVIKEFAPEITKPINTCSSCSALLIPDTASVNFISREWDGHSYKFDCECHPGLRLSIG